MAELPQQTSPGAQQGMAQQAIVTKPNPKPGLEQGQNPEVKKSKKWIWIIVGVVALILLGLGAWLLFFR